MVCTKCKKRKLVTKFSKHKTGKNGLRPQCKECCNARNKDWYNNRGGKERKALTSKEWRENKGGKERAALTKKIWCENHKEHISLREKDRYYNNGGKEQ